jgi:WD40 repeat protein
MRGHLDWVNHLAFAPDGRRMATAAADGVIRVWDPTTSEEVRAFRGHERQISGLAFSADSKQLLSTADDGRALVWDTSRDQAVVTRDLAFPHATSVHLLPDDRRAVVVHNWCGYQILDLRSGELSLEIRPKGLIANATDSALSPDGKWLAISSNQGGAHLISLDDTNVEARAISDAPRAATVAFSPDSKWLAAGYYNGRIVVHTVGGKVENRTIGSMRHVVYAVAFDPVNANRLGAVCGDGTIRIWDLTSGDEVLTLDAREHVPIHLVFSPDGRHLATAGAVDHIARIWDAKTGRLIRKFEGHTRSVECVAFSRDGNRLVTGSQDLNVKVWDVETGLPTLTMRGHTRSVRRVAFDRNGSSLVSVGGAQLKLWDGHAAYLFEQGRLLSLGCRVRQAKAEWTPETGVRGTFRLVNESGGPLSVPPVSAQNSRVRVYIHIERLGSDPLIPAIRHVRPDLRDQYSIAVTEVMPPQGKMTPAALVDGKFAFSTVGWPSGKYRVHLEHGWPGDANVAHTTCDFVIAD